MQAYGVQNLLYERLRIGVREQAQQIPPAVEKLKGQRGQFVPPGSQAGVGAVDYDRPVIRSNQDILSGQIAVYQ